MPLYTPEARPLVRLLKLFRSGVGPRASTACEERGKQDNYRFAATPHNRWSTSVPEGFRGVFRAGRQKNNSVCVDDAEGINAPTFRRVPALFHVYIYTRVLAHLVELPHGLFVPRTLKSPGFKLMRTTRAAQPAEKDARILRWATTGRFKSARRAQEQDGLVLTTRFVDWWPRN